MPSKRHPALIGTPPGVFQPAAVGVVPGYAKTEEAYNVRCHRLRANSSGARAAGLMTRRGIPNGFRGQRERIGELRAASAAEGWRIVNQTFANARLPAERLDELAAGPESEHAPAQTADERAAVCLAVGMSFVICPTYAASDRLRAAKLVLPYLVTMPRGAVATLRDGMEFIRELAKDGAKAG